MEEVLKKLNLEFFGMGKHKISPEEFFNLKDGILLDVRAEEEVDTLTFKLKHHRNISVLNIPIDQLPARTGEIPTDKPIALFCSAKVRAAIAYAYLLSKGLSEARILDGGYESVVGALKPGKVFKALQNRE